MKPKCHLVKRDVCSKEIDFHNHLWPEGGPATEAGRRLKLASFVVCYLLFSTPRCLLPPPACSSRLHHLAKGTSMGKHAPSTPELLPKGGVL